MNSEILLDMVWAQLKTKLEVSEEEVRSAVVTVNSILVADKVDNNGLEQVIKQLEARLNVRMGAGSVISDRKVKPWLQKARRDMDQSYWAAYEKHLEEEGFSPGPNGVIRAIDQATDRTLEQMGNPKSKTPFDIRGMVVGNVQSGKTANYIGLINKAVDAGYRVIIVIAGIHNNLRNQTQLRIDEGCIGRSSDMSEDGKIGVGVHRKTDGMPWSFTNPYRDFNKTTAETMGGRLADINAPSVFVIKKNVSTLRNLTNWLKSYNAEAGQDLIVSPMMLIDDEADNASINIAYRRDEVSRINGQIRELMNCFAKATYVGYTATPFANIFIAPDADDEMVGDELFPRNFIVGLDAPSNYHGSERIFLEESTPSTLIEIDDNADTLPVTHRIHFEVSELPESLEEAVRAFIIACAIREGRGQGQKHMSMLVNASRFVGIQEQLKSRIADLVRHYTEALRVHGRLPLAKALQNPRIAELADTFNRIYSGNEPGVEFGPLLPNLDIAASIVVYAINGRSRDSLSYSEHPEGLKVIAIGGFSLSRGLTLEGLVTTYFLRNSRMYDTLLQMGRWFGYRNGYEDLVRVWMSPEMQGAFSEIANATRELQNDLRVMQAAGATPEQFGLRVRQSPNSLMITARNKEGDGETRTLSSDLERSFIETAWLRNDEDDFAHNRTQAHKLVDDLLIAGLKPVDDNTDIETGSGEFFTSVDVSHVERFLRGFRNEDNYSPRTEAEAVLRYIRPRTKTLGGRTDEMDLWDILFVGIDRPKHDNIVIDDFATGPLITQMRSIGRRSTDEALVITDKQRVASRGIEKTGISKRIVQRQQAIYLEQKGAVRSFPDYIYREVRERPLLIVHHLDIRKNGSDDDRLINDPVVAWSISFGESELEGSNTTYRVNRIFLRTLTGGWRDDEDDLVDEITEDLRQADILDEDCK